LIEIAMPYGTATSVGRTALPSITQMLHAAEQHQAGKICSLTNPT
jgi:hypothetical protein